MCFSLTPSFAPASFSSWISPMSVARLSQVLLYCW